MSKAEEIARGLTQNQRDCLLHTLGLNQAKKSYRNYFAAGPESEDDKDLAPASKAMSDLERAWRELKAGLGVALGGEPCAGELEAWRQDAAARLKMGERRGSRTPQNLGARRMSTLPELALSVRQPWAWALIYGGKPLENRTRGALMHMLGRQKRGRICIHAAKGMTRDEYESALLTFEAASRAGELLVPLADVPKPDALVRGAIIGTVNVVGVAQESASQWWCGPRALICEEPVAVEPIPCLGALGYFNWSDPARKLAALQEPLPWMKAWPGTFHPFRAGEGVKPPPDPLPLFGGE